MTTRALARPLDDGVLIGAALSLEAATVHAWLAPDHFSHAAWLGVGFVLAAAAQTAWVMRPAVRVGLLVNLACVGAWLVSRTLGLPGQPVEPAGVLDLLTVGAELSLCGLLVGARGARLSGLVFAAALVCVLVSGMAGHP